jgi:hypothetical protein
MRRSFDRGQREPADVQRRVGGLQVEQRVRREEPGNPRGNEDQEKWEEGVGMIGTAIPWLGEVWGIGWEAGGGRMGGE